MNVDGFVKSPSAVLRFIFSHCGVPVSTPHSQRLFALAALRSVPPLRGGFPVSRALHLVLFTVPYH